MKLSKLIEDLRQDEGVVPHAYQDSLGYWTIGVGHLIDKRKAGGLPDHVIDALLEYDVDKVIEELGAELPVFHKLNDVRQNVLLNMAFNLGVPGLLKFPAMIRRLEAGDFDGAAREMLDSLWATQVGRRAQRLAREMRSGEFD